MVLCCLMAKGYDAAREQNRDRVSPVPLWLIHFREDAAADCGVLALIAEPASRSPDGVDFAGLGVVLLLLVDAREHECGLLGVEVLGDIGDIAIRAVVVAERIAVLVYLAQYGVLGTVFAGVGEETSSAEGGLDLVKTHPANNDAGL